MRLRKVMEWEKRVPDRTSDVEVMGSDRWLRVMAALWGYINRRGMG